MRRMMSALAAAGFCTLGLSTGGMAQTAPETSVEDLHWELALTSGSPDILQSFLDTYPDSTHTTEAVALMTQLRDEVEARELEVAMFALAGQVTFSRPLTVGTDVLGRKSIEDVIETSSPLYPPIDGLPENVWSDASCSDCHQWTQATLCSQAKTYAASSDGAYRHKRHPMGGALKMNLRNWAEGGCPN